MLCAYSSRRSKRRKTRRNKPMDENSPMVFQYHFPLENNRGYIFTLVAVDRPAGLRTLRKDFSQIIYKINEELNELPKIQ